MQVPGWVVYLGLVLIVGLGLWVAYLSSFASDEVTEPSVSESCVEVLAIFNQRSSEFDDAVDREESAERISVTLPNTPAGNEIEAIATRTEARRRQQNDKDQAIRSAEADQFRAVERAAILAEQNPDCFTPQERADIEAAYRSWKAAR